MTSCYAKGDYEFNPHKDPTIRATFFAAHSDPESSAVAAYSGHHNRQRMASGSRPVLRLRAVSPLWTRCKPMRSERYSPSSIDSLSAKTLNNHEARHISASVCKSFHQSQVAPATLNFRASSAACCTSANAAVDEPVLAVRSLQIHLNVIGGCLLCSSFPENAFEVCSSALDHICELPQHVARLGEINIVGLRLTGGSTHESQFQSWETDPVSVSQRWPLVHMVLAKLSSSSTRDQT